MMDRILAIAGNTFRETNRNRVMYVLLLFAMSVVAPVLATVGLADTWMDFRGRAARAAG